MVKQDCCVHGTFADDFVGLILLRVRTNMFAINRFAWQWSFKVRGVMSKVGKVGKGVGRDLPKSTIFNVAIKSRNAHFPTLFCILHLEKTHKSAMNISVSGHHMTILHDITIVVFVCLLLGLHPIMGWIGDVVVFRALVTAETLWHWVKWKWKSGLVGLITWRANIHHKWRFWQKYKPSFHLCSKPSCLHLQKVFLHN